MNSVPVLVISCDRYADLWRPFFTLFFKQWPACPHPVYLGTNFGQYGDPRVRTLKVGSDLSWATGVASMLDNLQSDFVILFLEDFLIQKAVDGDAVLRFVHAAQKERVACIRLSPLPLPSKLPSRAVSGYPELGVVEPDTPYRVSAQPAIWRVDALRRFLVPGFSAWQFEEVGSRLSAYGSESFWGPFQPAVVYEHGVEKGLWKPSGLAICRSFGIDVDLDARRAFSSSEFDEFHRSREESGRLFIMKRRVVDEFIRGEKRIAVRVAREILRVRPWWLELYGILLAGLLGRGPIRLLDRLQLAAKVRRSRREFLHRMASAQGAS